MLNISNNEVKSTQGVTPEIISDCIAYPKNHKTDSQLTPFAATFLDQFHISDVFMTMLAVKVRSTNEFTKK